MSVIGHNLTPAAVLDQVHRCREQTSIIRRYLFFERSGVNHDIPHRCDVYMKCTYCSHAWAHGLPISEEYFNGPGLKKMWSWREVRAFYAGTLDTEEDLGYEPEESEEEST
jgi:hypothetical protein